MFVALKRYLNTSLQASFAVHKKTFTEIATQQRIYFWLLCLKLLITTVAGLIIRMTNLS